MNYRIIFALCVLMLSVLACGQYVGTPTPAVTLTPTAPPLTPSPLPSPTAQPTGTATDEARTAIVRAALVNVRAKPNGEVVGQIEAGQEVTILETDGDWVRIADPAGWVYIGCLEGLSEKGCVTK